MYFGMCNREIFRVDTLGSREFDTLVLTCEKYFILCCFKYYEHNSYMNLKVW